MEACPRPEVTYPLQIPLKVIGEVPPLQVDMVLELVVRHLGALPEGDGFQHAHHKGKWTSLTFQVTLPDDGAERPLREAIQRLPGVVMQL